MLTESEIQVIVSPGNYKSSNVSVLEQYVEALCRGQQQSSSFLQNYRFDMIRTLMKSYQLFPDKVQSVYVACSCWLALLQYPQTDFLALSYMIHPSMMMGSSGSTSTTVPVPVSSSSATSTTTTTSSSSSSTSTIILGMIQKAYNSLNECQFEQFWKIYHELCQYTTTTTVQQQTKKNANTTAEEKVGGTGSAAAGDDDNSSSNKEQDWSILESLLIQSKWKVQHSILSVLALSYKEVPLSVVDWALNDDTSNNSSSSATTTTSTTKSMSDLVERITENGMVIFIPTTDNTKRRRVYHEAVSFNTISHLLHKMGQ